MVLTSHRDSRRYYFVVTGADCEVTLQAASPKDKVRFQFHFFLVYSLSPVVSGTPLSAHQEHLPRGSPKPPPEQETQGPCATGSFVQLYDGQDHSAPPLGGPLCGKSIPRPVLSTGSFLTLRLLTRGRQPRVDFVGGFTSLRTGKLGAAGTGPGRVCCSGATLPHCPVALAGLNASACEEEMYFPCRNGRCIPHSLVCDSSNVDNCGDGSDQAVQSPALCQGQCDNGTKGGGGGGGRAPLSAQSPVS